MAFQPGAYGLMQQAESSVQQHQCSGCSSCCVQACPIIKSPDMRRRFWTLVTVVVAASSIFHGGLKLSVPAFSQHSSDATTSPQAAWKSSAAHARLQDVLQNVGALASPQSGYAAMSSTVNDAVGSQTFTEVSRFLSHCAYRLMLSAGDHALGHDNAAQELRVELKGWRQGMLNLASSYQNLQGRFNGLARSHSEGLSRTVRMWTSFKRDVEAMLKLESCRQAGKLAASPRQEAAAADCRNASDTLLQAMLNRADGVIGWLDSTVQQLRRVVAEQAKLVSHVDSKIDQMTDIQDDASNMAAAATSDVRQKVRNLQRADVKAGSLIVAGGASFASITAIACLAAGPASAAACAAWPALSAAAGVVGLAGTGVIASVERAHHLAALKRSAQVRTTLIQINEDCVVALKDIMAVREVLLAQAEWLESLQSLATATQRAVEDVVEIITSATYTERQVVLRELEAAAATMLRMLGRLSGEYQQGAGAIA